MTPTPSRRFYLLTYPRTASNLLLKILAPQDQPTLYSSGKEGYFFAPTIGLRLGKFKTAGRHLHEWTQEERIRIGEAYQKCFEALQAHVEKAETEGKDVLVKEHVPWLIEPVSETRWIFGEDSIHELPWTVKTMVDQSRSNQNETIFPDQFLKTWLPTFLIRHPALVFPSNYRAVLDLEGRDVAQNDSGAHSFEMTMHWSRSLYDCYVQALSTRRLDTYASINWPVVLDADDIMVKPEVIIRYSEIIGLDPDRLKSSWPLPTEDELDKLDRIERRMRSTLTSSTGIVAGKTSIGLNIDEEATKWKLEFGKEEGEKIETWVRDAMPDYEYMKARRLRPLSS